MFTSKPKRSYRAIISAGFLDDDIKTTKKASKEDATPPRAHKIDFDSDEGIKADSAAKFSSATDVTPPKMHKIDLDLDESIKTDFASKFKTTTDAVTDKVKPEVTTEMPSTTQKQITTEAPKVKTTTSNVPFDDHTTTTEAEKPTTVKPAIIPPAQESHYLRWVLGETFATFYSTNFAFQQKVFKNYSKLNKLKQKKL